MSIEACRIEIRKLINEDELSNRELNKILHEADAIKADHPTDFHQKIMEMAKERVLEIKENAKNKLLQSEMTTNLESYMQRMRDEKFGPIKRKVGMTNQTEAKLEAMIEGRGLAGFGSNNSVGNYQSVYHAFLNGPIDTFVQTSGITNEQLLSKEFGKDVLRELYHLNAGEKGFATENKLAQDLAAIYKDQTFKGTRDAFSAVGLDVAYNKNYAGLRRYDREKVLAAKENFVDFLMSDQMDRRTFATGATTDDKLKRATQAWEHITQGNQADFTKHRSLYFADADAEHNFMERFGYFDNHFSSVQAQVKTSAKLLGMMQVFGPNYKEVFDKLATNGGVGENSLVRNMFKDLSGELASVHETPLSQMAAAARSFEALTKLPNAIISAFMPDHVAAAALAGAVDGRGLLPALNETIAHYMKAGNTEQRRQLAEAMMLNSFDLAATYSDGATVGLNGKLTKATTALFKYSGLTGHSEMMRTSVATTLGKMLHGYADKEFSQLSKEVIATFDRYAINEIDWNVIRKAEVEVAGIRLLSPKTVLEMADIPFKDKQSAFLKLGSMINDHAKLTTLESNAYSRQSLLWGTKEGTPLGELMRFIAQFKQSGIGMMRLQGRLMHSMDAPAYGAALGVFGLAGYLTTVGRDFLVRGITPEVPNTDTPEGKARLVIMAAESLNRGAGGLMGDTLIAEYDKSYRNLAKDFLGPVASQVADVAKFGAAGVRGDIGAHEQEILNFAQTLVPFANGMGIKPVMEGLVMDHLHNTLNSSYEINVKRKLRERGQRRLKDIVSE